MAKRIFAILVVVTAIFLLAALILGVWSVWALDPEVAARLNSTAELLFVTGVAGGFGSFLASLIAFG